MRSIAKEDWHAMARSSTRGTPPHATHRAAPSNVLTCVRYVYLLRSTSHPDRRYVGSTDDLRRRIGEHNDGKAIHTAKSIPWRLVAAIAFEDDARALAFEQYLKSGSGIAFANRRLW